MYVDDVAFGVHKQTHAGVRSVICLRIAFPIIWDTHADTRTHTQHMCRSSQEPVRTYTAHTHATAARISDDEALRRGRRSFAALDVVAVAAARVRWLAC